MSIEFLNERFRCFQIPLNTRVWKLFARGSIENKEDNKVFVYCLITKYQSVMSAFNNKAEYRGKFRDKIKIDGLPASAAARDARSSSLFSVISFPVELLLLVKNARDWS